MHVVDTRGRVHSGGEGVILLLSLNPRTRWRALAARLVPPLRRKIAHEYEMLASRRAELSEKVPDVDPTTVPPRWTRLSPDR